jgi:hypothetical protein
MLFTFFHPCHILWIALWQTSSESGIGNRTWFGLHVRPSKRETGVAATYRRCAVLEPPELRRIDSSQMAREQIGEFKTLSVDFFPRESHLITFRDPWSFPVLFHPACNHLVRGHMHDLTKKVCPLLNLNR